VDFFECVGERELRGGHIMGASPRMVNQPTTVVSAVHQPPVRYFEISGPNESKFPVIALIRTCLQ
jgi:hypothetical protein